MRVKDICAREVKSCRLDTNLADAAWTMWEGDCGILPVVDEAGKVVGVITDRDICMGAAFQGRPARDILVRAVIGTPIHCCRLEEEVRDALRAMRLAKVRRLPVADADGALRGMLSLNDVALAARPDSSQNPADITYEDLVHTFKAICQHRVFPQEHVEARTVMPAGTR